MAGRTIAFQDEADFLVQSGLTFLDELKSEGTRPGAPEGIRRDWETVANWIGYSSGNLTTEQTHKLEQGWAAYLAIGLAPSLELQSAFSLFSEQIGEIDKAHRAPTEIMDIFDRLLATDDKIRAKRAIDRQEELARLRPLFDGIKSGRQSWWRRQSQGFRKWAFCSIVWAAFIFIYARFFDPFDTGGWRYMSESENTQFLLLLFAPVAAGTALYVYNRWVK